MFAETMTRVSWSATHRIWASRIGSIANGAVSGSVHGGFHIIVVCVCSSPSAVVNELERASGSYGLPPLTKTSPADQYSTKSFKGSGATPVDDRTIKAMRIIAKATYSTRGGQNGRGIGVLSDSGIEDTRGGRGERAGHSDR